MATLQCRTGTAQPQICTNLELFCRHGGCKVIHMATQRDEAERFAQAVSAQVRAEIAARDESVLGLSRKTGIPRGSLLRWVSGERALTVPNLYKIATALGMDPHLLVMRAEERFASEAGAAVANFPALSVVPDSVAAYKNDGTHKEFDESQWDN